MPDEHVDRDTWRVFRIFVSTLPDPELESAHQQLESEIASRRERDRNAARLLFSSLEPADLDIAGHVLVAERAARAAERRKLRLITQVEASGLLSGSLEAVCEGHAVPVPGEQAGRRSSPQVSGSAQQIVLACGGRQRDECDDCGRRGIPKKKPTAMTTFTISDDHNITVFASAEEAARAGHAAAQLFDSPAGLASITAEWPLSRLLEIYNGIPGNSEVRRFADRNKAVARIWNAMQPLARTLEAPATPSKKGARPEKTVRPDKPHRKAITAKPPKTVPANNARREGGSKKEAVLAMMKRANGVTLAKIMTATGWQAHTVRGMVSILGSKGGLKIQSSKNAAGERTYRIHQ